MFAGERFLSFFLFLCFSRPRSLSSQPSSAAELTSHRSSARTSQSKVRRALIRRDPICALLDLCAAEKRLRRSELASCRLLHTSLGQLGPIKRAPSKLLSRRREESPTRPPASAEWRAICRDSSRAPIFIRLSARSKFAKQANEMLARPRELQLDPRSFDGRQGVASGSLMTPSRDRTDFCSDRAAPATRKKSPRVRSRLMTRLVSSRLGRRNRCEPIRRL